MATKVKASLCVILLVGVHKTTWFFLFFLVIVILWFIKYFLLSHGARLVAQWRSSQIYWNVIVMMFRLLCIPNLVYMEILPNFTLLICEGLRADELIISMYCIYLPWLIFSLVTLLHLILIFWYECILKLCSGLVVWCTETSSSCHFPPWNVSLWVLVDVSAAKFTFEFWRVVIFYIPIWVLVPVSLKSITSPVLSPPPPPRASICW